MAFINLRKHYFKMKMILSIIEAGEWQKYPDVAKMTIEQIETMRKTVIEMEILGFNKRKEVYIN